MNKKATAVAGTLVTAMMLSACGSGGSSNPSASQAASLPAASLVAPVEGMACTEGTKPSGAPIVVGESLSLTGALAPTAAIHNGVANLVVEWVNRCGGITGRPLELKVLDDQSTPAQAASNYERLINDKVNLVMGAYGGANILAGAGPVGRAGYAYFTSSNGAPDQSIGDFHFPSWQFGNGGKTKEDIFGPTAQTLWSALESTGTPPKSVFYATAKFPTTLSLAEQTRIVFEGKGAKTSGSLQYDLGTTDFSSVALRIQKENPDFVYVGSLGGDITNLYAAFNTIGYTPKGIYAALPAAAAVAQLGKEAEGLMTLSIYENQPPLSDTPIAQYFAQEYAKVAQKNKLFPIIEAQAAGEFGAWQILLSGVQNAGVDNAAIIKYLKSHEVKTIAGTVSFTGFNNYSTDFNRVTQIQDGKRVMVWPKELANGTKPVYKP